MPNSSSLDIDLKTKKEISPKQYQKAKASLLQRKADAHQKIVSGATVYAIFGKWLTKKEADEFIFCCKEFKKIIDRYLTSEEMKIFVKLCKDPDNKKLFEKNFEKLKKLSSN